MKDEDCRGDRQVLQRKSSSCDWNAEIPPIVHEVLRSPGQPLDQETRNYFEPRFGHDFSNVRVHTDTKAAESARAVNALAYTVGKNVVFGAGQYAPVTTPGRTLISHELSHVIQQTSTLAAHRSKGRSYSLMRQKKDGSEKSIQTLCHAPSELLEPTQASAFGILAEKFIDADYCSKMGCNNADDYFDNPFSGAIDPGYIAFLIRRNRKSLSSEQIVALTIMSIERPDIMSDKASRKEFYEIKPDSIPGRAAGRAKIAAVSAYLRFFGLPYKAGTAFQPTPSAVIASTSIFGHKAEVLFKVRRASDGLLVYEVCLSGELLEILEKVTIGVLLAILAIILAIILKGGRFPGRGPVLIPEPVMALLLKRNDDIKRPRERTIPMKSAQV